MNFELYMPIYERKGSLTLRADHAEYDLTKTKVSNWDQDAESYPKDYDCKKDPVWNLKKATYKYLSNNGLDFPKTTTQDLYDDLKLKSVYGERPKSDFPGSHSQDRRLDTLAPKIIGTNPPSASKLLDITTYVDDYKWMGGEFKPKVKTAEELELEAKLMREKDILTTSANKSNLSQFTEKYNPKRYGRNTWQDETGVYATALHKRLNTQQFNPILNSYVS